MDLLDQEKIEEEVQNTIKGLADKEAKNAISFTDWPNTLSSPTEYDLEPKKRRVRGDSQHPSSSGLGETKA